jgi:hypothetical protein
VSAVGRSGPAFGHLLGRLPRLGPRRAEVETPERRGLAAAIMELGGLPDDDLPSPPSFGRRRRTEPSPFPRRERGIEHPPGAELAADARPDVGVMEPDDWAPGRAKEPGVTQGPREVLARGCRMLGLPHPRVQYVWERDRGWWFDLAWPRWRVAVAIDGGWRIGSRMVYGAGYLREVPKLNEAQIEGWMVLRLTAPEIRDGSGLRLVARALTSPWRRL